MGFPKVSILWLNYNSMNIIGIVKESLKAVADLDYDNYELVVVDNGSTDHSNMVIKDFLDRIRNRIPRVKLIQLRRNLGFAAGCNIAFQLIDPGSKYVVLLNNDAIPLNYSLRVLIDEMEADEKVGSVQGIILNYENGLVDSAGGLVDELLRVYLYMRNAHPRMIRDKAYITYADGAFSVHRVSAVLTINHQRILFPGELFAYYDDVLLGLQMWRHGFKVMMIPVITARHKRGATFSRYNARQLYLNTRNHAALMQVSNSRYKKMLLPYILRAALPVIARNKDSSKVLTKAIIKAIADSTKLATSLKRRGIYLDIYRAPIIYLGLKDLAKTIILRRLAKTTHDHLHISQPI